MGAGTPFPSVAVVIPAYNAAWCIRDALDSLAAQTFQDFETVIVDDGSTDDTGAVVAGYLDSGALQRLRLITQENKGLGGARNTGIRETSAPLVAFLDQDDTWFPRRLERVVETFASLPDDVGLVCHDEIAVREGVPVRTLHYGPWSRRMYERLLFRGSLLSPAATTIRRPVLEEAGGFSEDPSFHFIEDYDLWLRLSRRTQFHFLHEPLGEFRLHGENFSNRIDYNVGNELSVLAAHFRDRFGDTPTLVQRARMRKRRQMVHRRAARRYLAAGDRANALDSLKRASRLYPLSPKAWALLALVAARTRE